MKILIIDDVHPLLIERLQAQGFAVDYCPTINRAALLPRLADCLGLVVRSKTAIDAALIDAASHLRFVARAGAGTDQVEMPALNRRGIALLNAPEGNRDAVAEHALAMLLALLNRLPQADAQVRQKIWQREANRGRELGTLTVGLVGYGNMGRAFARRLSGFGCRVLAYDKYQKGYADAYADACSLEEIFEQADVLSLHVPLTPETRHWANENFFNQFKKNIYFVNTARGEIAPLAGLRAALQSGKLLGACLDVLENEKLATLNAAQQADFEFLAASDRVIFSPHVAGWTYESYRRISEVLAEKIINLLKN